ncbi:GIY-YIG nuclease family protein [Streptomyces sp. NPDC086669]|uniref:GIY-YIG nuclease family protein n=1 Tax=Streptomyces sp. NPDC086669 TaxID=3365753 RepID=UPI003813351C
MTLRVTHFPLRKLDRDAPTKCLLTPEHTHPDWKSSHKIDFLYRFYSSDLQPLYIGVTSGSGLRWDQHRKQSEWWPLAEYVAVSFYESYESVRVAEKAAIRHERPRFNRLHVRGPANTSLRLHGPAEAAAAQLFRDADADFISELARLLTEPDRFPQPEPPPPARFADDGAGQP